jgi:aspartate/methionine/tyrosine aminotransferase
MYFESSKHELMAKETLSHNVHSGVWSADHVDKVKDQPFIFQAYGETWFRVPETLQNLLGQAPAMDHGYQLSSWGRPSYRSILREYILQDHRIPTSTQWEVGLSSQGTRMRMFDFARWLAKRSTHQPVVVYAQPGWDYEGVFAAAQFKSHTYPLSLKEGFQPSLDAVETIMRQHAHGSDNAHIVLVLNVQHNPTGITWSKSRVTQLIELALSYRTSLLIDDAYYGVVSPGAERVSALEILHQFTETESLPPWLAVRSLGKQFHCNGWGVGAVIAEKSLMQELEGFFYQHTYPYGGFLQYAMTQWLQMKESNEFLQQLNQEYQTTKEAIVAFLAKQPAYPKEALYLSDCTPYYLIQVPPKYMQEGPAPDQSFNKDVLQQHNLLLGRGSLAYTDANAGWQNAWTRLYLGAGPEVMEESLRRLAHYSWAGI